MNTSDKIIRWQNPDQKDPGAAGTEKLSYKCGDQRENCLLLLFRVDAKRPKSFQLFHPQFLSGLPVFLATEKFLQSNNTEIPQIMILGEKVLRHRIILFSSNKGKISQLPLIQLISCLSNINISITSFTKYCIMHSLSNLWIVFVRKVGYNGRFPSHVLYYLTSITYQSETCLIYHHF